MAKEIERKYLVDLAAVPGLVRDNKESVALIKQGYLSTDPDRTVRIRFCTYKDHSSTAFQTTKGRTKGITRKEFEYLIPYDDAKEMIKMCVGDVVEKRRYNILYDTCLWSLDVFIGKSKGLVLAEIEIPHTRFKYKIPEWITKDVTNDYKYSCSSLAKKPYTLWKK
jgi:adenylate cyclase